MAILAPSSRHNITRVQRPTSAYPSARMYYPPSMIPALKPITANIVHAPSDGLGPDMIELVDDPYTIDQWLLRDESVARCLIDDARALKQVAPDIFMLNTFPCKYVELVGMIVSIDIKENNTTYTLDDGSSQNIDIKYVHNFATLARKAQECPQPSIAKPTRLSRASSSSTSVSTSFTSPPRRTLGEPVAVFQSYIPPKPLLLKRKHDPIDSNPIPVHVPKVSIGDVTRVRVKVRKWMDNLQFFAQADLSRTDVNDEPLHAILAMNLRREIYPNFTQSTYLSSPFLPKRASTSTLTSTSKSSKTKTKESGSPGSGRSDRSSSVGFSDMSESSSVYATSDLSSPLRDGSSRTPSKSRETHRRQRDPSKIPSDQTTLDEFKLWIKEHMVTLTSIAWDQQTERELDNGPVKQWFSELRTSNSESLSGWAFSRPSDRIDPLSWKGKEKSRVDHPERMAIKSENSLSFDASASFDTLSDSVSFAFTTLSTSTYFHQVLSDLSSEPISGPPFTARSLTKVPHLLLYAQKMVKKTAKEWEKRRREDIMKERAEEKAAMGSESRRKRVKHEAWFSLAELELKRKEGDLADWENGDGGAAATKVTIKARERERENIRRKEIERERRRGESYTSKLKVPAWVAGKVLNLMEHVLAELVREGEIVSTDLVNSDGGSSDPPGPMYLPLHLITLGPVLFRLINTENASIRARSKKTLPAGIKPPFGVDTQTIMRRLKSSEERWYFVSEIKVEDMLDQMDKRDWIEYQRGGWRAL